MPKPCTVVIGAPELLDALRERAGTGSEVLAFTDRDALKALEAITERRPAVVTLERLFAATSRGAALINRIKADPSLASAEIRVVSYDGSYSRVSPRRMTPAAAAAGPAATAADTAAVVAPAQPLDYRGTRRSPRYRMIEGTEAQVDGATAAVFDLSRIGAQIVSSVALRPQQQVRMVLSDDEGKIKIKAAVVWASYEIPEPATRYRLGLEFIDADAAAIDGFCKRHQLV